MHVVWPLMCNDDRIHADRGGMSGADRSRVAEGPERPKSIDDQRAPGLIARNSTNSRAQNLHFCRQMRRFCTWQARLALSGPALFVGCMHCQRHGGGVVDAEGGRCRQAALLEVLREEGALWGDCSMASNSKMPYIFSR